MSDSPEVGATAVRQPSSESARQTARFTPGALLGGRFRIIALLGTGGMGEVFRAEDIRMGQQVALKFLPDEFSSDAAKLERLYGEVRIGRQVSHPNVCRTYDLVEADGHAFLSMEYIDGEDLGTLLRRIGRLPEDKALAVAREVAAGLSAAHALGVIHRDLKPANVMIDGRGHARITDFGLAVVADDARARHEVAGTPAYMSPEQLEGGEVTHRSDLYAMGALLYELFTGKRLFDGQSAGAIRSAHSSGTQSAAREMASIDPTVQKLILRCLEKDPARRPSSIHAFIAALPGGDPLQAAIDAGETPSPEMLAAAGESGELRPAMAWPLFLSALLLLAVAFVVTSRATFPRAVRLPLTRDALAFRAQEFLKTFARLDPPRDSFGRFRFDSSTVERRPFARSAGEMDRLRPSPGMFYYRQSPQLMGWRTFSFERTPTDPPFNRPGMAEARLDPEGRLTRFATIARDVEAVWAADVDWAPAFTAADIDSKSIAAVPPVWTPPVGSDHRYAWRATLKGQPNVPMRIEAASLAGKPVWFEVIPPWKKPRPLESSSSTRAAVLDALAVAMKITLLIVALVLARRNLRSGRSDTKLATRLGLMTALLGLIGMLLHMDHSRDIAVEYSMIALALENAVTFGVTVWVLYVALEPYLRRRWPRSLVAWKRLFDGRMNDPLVGREVLVGVTITAVLIIIYSVRFLFPSAAEPTGWIVPEPAALEGPLHFFELLAIGIAVSMATALTSALFLLVSHVVVRNRTATIVTASLLMGLMLPFQSASTPGAIAGRLLCGAILVVVVARRGILAATVATLGIPLIIAAPVTLDVNDWFFWRAVVYLLVLFALATWSFVRSVGSQPLFSGAVLEE